MKKFLPARHLFFRKIIAGWPLIFSSLFLALIIFLNINVSSFAQTDKCSDQTAINSMSTSELSDCISTLSRAKDQSVAATAGVQKQVNGIKARVSQIENDIPVKQKQIADGEKRLFALLEVLNDAVRKYYIGSQGNCPICELILSSSIADFTKIRAYQQISIDQNKALITNAAILVRALQIQKADLEEEKVGLAAVKVKLDKVVAESLTYQSTLSSQISQLSARQQQIISQRQTALGIPRSAGASSLYCTDDRKINPGFSSGFAFFTYGIPHYIGMNQYGAYGRATAGQNYKDILNAYFQNISIECRDIPTSIDVQVYGSMNFEDYIKGVVNKEMGADLPEALKAQAIAARSFAMNESKPICTTQSCQVYSNDRRDAASSAVDATGQNACGAGKAEFVIANGSIAKTWYASTFGGYAHTSAQIWGGNTSYTKNFADTTGSVSSFSELTEKAYDRESACFYTAQGWRDGEYKKSAWLRPEEVVDILNTLLLVKADSSTGEHLYQTDKGNPAGTDTWDANRVKQELQNKGITPYNSIASISVSADFVSGVTTSVSISGSRSDNFNGNEFKDRFNLRAPANIQIVGPLYNVERN